MLTCSKPRGVLFRRETVLSLPVGLLAVGDCMDRAVMVTAETHRADRTPLGRIQSASAHGEAAPGIVCLSLLQGDIQGGASTGAKSAPGTGRRISPERERGHLEGPEQRIDHIGLHPCPAPAGDIAVGESAADCTADFTENAPRGLQLRRPICCRHWSSARPTSSPQVQTM